MTDLVPRRSVLLGACATCAVIVTGCAGSSGGTAAATSGARTTGGTATPTGTSPGGRSGAAAALAALDDIPVGRAVSATAPDGKPILIARTGSATAVAFSAICTHAGCTVAPAGPQLECPCHGSVYSATTGKVKQGPAPRALPPFPVVVRDGQVFPA